MWSLRISIAAWIALVAGCDGIDRSRPTAWSCPGCNVVLVTVDTLRPDHLGIYGYSRDTSPEIDRFFAEGIRFDTARSPSPCTLPAVRQMLTGSLRKAPQRKRLAEYLSLAGYRTAAVVSQHHFRIGRRGAPRSEYARGFDHFDLQAGSQLDHHELSTRDAGDLTDRALVWLKAEASRGRFFLWLHYFDPHDPYAPPQTHRVFGDEATRAQDGDRRSAMTRGYAFSPEEVTALRALYDGEIRYLDAELGRILRRLEKSDLRDRTLVVLSADHGEHLGEDGRWDHCQSLHARELAVPLLLRVPGTEGPRTIDRLVSTLDILPTILRLVGVPVRAGSLDGAPLDSVTDSRQVVGVWADERMLRDREWKVYASADVAPRLYRISKDPSETTDLAADEPERVATMTHQLAQAAGIDEQSRSTRETVKRLRAIGYVDDRDTP